METVADTGSAGSTSSSGSASTPPGLLDEVTEWLATYVRTMSRDDIDVIALWAVHTHLTDSLYTSPRLLLDSPMPGSGKTTVLEHLVRLTHRAIQAASLSSPALLARLLEHGPRTILIDEADRTLNESRDIATELFAVLNSGYKRGGSRPVLVATKDGWDAVEMSTYAPVAMAGNSPNLPDDTRSRTIPVLLMPDLDDTIAESDWEHIEADALALGERIAQWAQLNCDRVRLSEPSLPPTVKGRARERWKPLAKVADAAGGIWPATVYRLAARDVERESADKEDGLTREKPHMLLIRDVRRIWAQTTADYLGSQELVGSLVAVNPDDWGDRSTYGKELTTQRMGRMLVKAFGIHSARPTGQEHRGYPRAAFEGVFGRLGMPLSAEPAELGQPVEPDEIHA